MEQNLQPGNWIICGDLNQMERVEDSVGPSPFMHGAERRAWNRFSNKMDLLDNRLIMVLKTRPHYARHSAHGSQFDQSRIDRSYCSNWGPWMHLVQEVIHDASQTLSNHHPIITRIALNPLAQMQRKRSSYMRMDVEELGVKSTREVVERVWKEQM